MSVLNKSNGNMYEFVTHTWNPLGGACPHGCSYCSTSKLKRYPVIREKYSGKPRLYENKFGDLGSGKFIFVAAQNDLFADNVQPAMIERVLDHCGLFDNKYLFQSKNPGRMNMYIRTARLDAIVCTTIETNRHYPEIMKNSPMPLIRAQWMELYSDLKHYVTIEPIMDFDHVELVRLIRMCNPVQVNIGADSGKNGLPEPSRMKIINLIEVLREFTKVEKKTNLERLLSR